jgi:drug/metabolite transporter (DMT)-like permease
MSFCEVHEDESELNLAATDPLILLPPINHEKITKKTNCFTRFSGIFYTLLASLLFTASTFIMKELGIDLLDALLLRFFLQTLLILAYAVYKKYTLLGGAPKQIVLQLLCCSTGAASLVLFFIAVRYVELSDVSTLCYTRVVWTVILSMIVYRERPSVDTLVALAITLIGVVFVTQPSFIFSSKVNTMSHVASQFRFLGFTMAFICALTTAVNVLLFKQLISTSRDVKPSVLSLQFSFAVLLFLIVNQLYKYFGLNQVMPLNYILSWRYALSSIVCLITIAGTVLNQKAIKREHPAVFSLLGSADIIFALVFQNIFTSAKSNAYALLGSSLVIGSVVLIGISRIINERRTINERLSSSKIVATDEVNGQC